jgi:hypothetical protein
MTDGSRTGEGEVEGDGADGVNRDAYEGGVLTAATEGEATLPPLYTEYLLG